MKRLGVLTSLVMAGSLAFAAPVLAAVPDNDTYAGRTPIGSFPFADSVDTTDATTDADDTEAKGPCGTPALDASVWYEITAASDGGLVVDVSGSTYSAAVIVATGGPGSFAFVTCGPDKVDFAATAGETYAILAFDWQNDGGGNGGTLNIVVDESPPPPTVDVTVDPVGHFDPRTGSATVGGTVTCTGTVVFITVQLQQTVGRFVVTGFGGTFLLCDETTQPWSAPVFPDNGATFKGGRAVSLISAQACGPSGCGWDVEERSVKLRGSPKRQRVAG